jgi:hypothetical protein
MKTDHRHHAGQFWVGCLGLALLFSSCALPTNAPLKSLFYPRPMDNGSRGLIVFLQGRGGSNTDFAANGFVEAINRRGHRPIWLPGIPENLIPKKTRSGCCGPG